jgi:hypothetical protein
MLREVPIQPDGGAASVAPAPATGTRLPRPRRGHHAKIEVAVAELRAEGLLPQHLRPKVRDLRVMQRLTRHGYHGDIPTHRSLARFFATYRW